MKTAKKASPGKSVSFSSKLDNDCIVIELKTLNGKPLTEEKALEFFKKQLRIREAELAVDSWRWAINYEGDLDNFAFGDCVEMHGVEYEVNYQSRAGTLSFYNQDTDNIVSVFCDELDTTIHTMM